MKKRSSLKSLEEKSIKARKAQISGQKMNLLFSEFTKNVAEIVGNAFTFLVAVFLIVVWCITGPLFHFSDTWQLVINTATTIVTFLIVFLIQHTQNRDTEIINLKLDELIRGHKGSRNTIIDLSVLSDQELKELEDSYKKLCHRKSKRESQ